MHWFKCNSFHTKRPVLVWLFSCWLKIFPNFFYCFSCNFWNLVTLYTNEYILYNVFRIMAELFLLSETFYFSTKVKDFIRFSFLNLKTGQKLPTSEKFSLFQIYSSPKNKKKFVSKDCFFCLKTVLKHPCDFFCYKTSCKNFNWNFSLHSIKSSRKWNGFEVSDFQTPFPQTYKLHCSHQDFNPTFTSSPKLFFTSSLMYLPASQRQWSKSAKTFKPLWNFAKNS